MSQEFFKQGASVEVTLREFPLAEDDEDLVVEGYIVERDDTGLLLDMGSEEEGQLFLPWSNIAQVLSVTIEEEEEEVLP